LELIHSDVVGKLETSYNDFNHYVTFLDDFFLERFGFILSNINQNVPNIFIKFHKFISNTTSYNIINFKFDHGREYFN